MPSMLRRMLVGQPLATAQQAHERLGNFAALAVFASDGLSSVAYATEEILLILVCAGPGALHLSLPISLAIAVLIAIVATSYRQVVYAYPFGGGAYAVARENLGVIPSLVAGASLLVDYVLTVAVSVAAGIAALTSAFPAWYEHRVALGLVAIAAVTIANLRGVRESARVFMLPTYGFVATMFVLIVAGLWRGLSGQGPVETLPVHTEQAAVGAVSLFLILRAFSSGCAALTGIEAVGNGVQAFREPVGANAARVLMWLALLLGGLFIGTSVIANLYHVVPAREETVVSQIARGTFGRTVPYYAVQFFTAVILILAANTSFNGFPRLASVQANDGYLPRPLGNVGDRLVYSNGIILLGLASGLLLAGFQGETHRLIPLYAVGVFLSFTLSQAGMVRHWMSVRDEQADWRQRAAINAVGAVVTGVVTLVIAISKWSMGAWIVAVVIPAFVVVFLRIHKHYEVFGRRLSLEGDSQPPLPGRNLVIVLVASVHRGMLEAVHYAKSLSSPDGDVRAVHIETESDRPRPSLLSGWERYGLGISLVTLQSPYRSIAEPLLEYVEKAMRDEDFDTVTLVIPEVVTQGFLAQFLHNQTALFLQIAFRNKPGVVIANFRYYL